MLENFSLRKRLRKRERERVYGSTWLYHNPFTKYRDHCQKIAAYIQKATRQMPSTPPPPCQYDQNNMGGWVSQPIGGWKLEHTVQKLRLLGGPGTCAGLKGRLPEIRTKELKDRLWSYMNMIGVYKAYAGVQFDANSGVYRYMSDKIIYNYNEAVMDWISYGGTWETWDHDIHITDGEVRKQASTHAIVYADPEGRFR